MRVKSLLREQEKGLLTKNALNPENSVHRGTIDFTKLSRYKHLFCLFSLLLGLVGIIIVAQSFSDENIWRKDFLGDYLTARAILLALDPYQPLSTLALIQGYSLPHGTFLHPNPHSPFLTVLSIPFGWFSYKTAAYLILAFEVCCLAFSVIGIGKWLGLKPAPFTTGAIVCLLAGWGAVWENLALGQTNLTILVLLVMGLRGLTTERHIFGGIAIGCAISLKIIYWPLLVPLLLYRKIRVLTAGLATIVVLNSLPIFVLGYQAVEHYYRYVSPTVATYHRAYFRNMSFWSVGWKLFEGTGSPSLAGISVPPLFDLPWLAPFFSYGLVGLLFCGSIILVVKVKNIEAAYAIMICFSLLMSPLCWSHYLVMMAIPFSFAVKRLLYVLSTINRRIALMIASSFLLVPGPSLVGLERWFQEYVFLNNPLILLAVSLIPMYGVLLCALLCYSFCGDGWRLTRDFSCQGGK
jgi:hypothetical protein